MDALGLSLPHIRAPREVHQLLQVAVAPLAGAVKKQRPLSLESTEAVLTHPAVRIPLRVSACRSMSSLNRSFFCFRVSFRDMVSAVSGSP